MRGPRYVYPEERTPARSESPSGAEVRSLLEDYRVDRAQGYYTGVPGPVEEVLAADASPTTE